MADSLYHFSQLVFFVLCGTFLWWMLRQNSAEMASMSALDSHEEH